MNHALRSALILVVILLVFATDLAAQPIGGPPPCWPPPCIPVDGGLGFLIAAGALLGGRKALEHRRRSKSSK
jgi:hypothetical protein